MAFNQLLADSVSHDDFEKLGFTFEQDGTGDTRGNSYDFENDNFFISIDAWYEVTLSRKNPDTDHISIIVESKHDLECLLDWISDDE